MRRMQEDTSKPVLINFQKTEDHLESTFVICCCITTHPKLKWLKITTNIYYLTCLLWVRNLRAASLGGSGSRPLTKLLSSCHLGTIRLEDLSASEMVLVHVAGKLVLAIGRLQFLPQSSGKSTYLTLYSRRNKVDK